MLVSRILEVNAFLEPLQRLGLFATLAYIRCEHHDRFAIPFDIYEAVAVQRPVDHFDYRAGRDCYGAILPILVNDC